MHEAQEHPCNAFLTLTYDDEHLPPDGGLQMQDFQNFMKRLRKFYSSPLRYFHCGEYGEKLSRPHYHAAVFGLHLDDQQLFTTTPNGDKLYISDNLTKLWTHGHATVGELTQASAAYIARYVIKKVNGPEKLDHYTNKETGVICSPEYITMSRRPGIGSSWFKKYSSDVYPSDNVIVNGYAKKPPRYYDKQLEKTNPTLLKKLLTNRAKRAIKLLPHTTTDGKTVMLDDNNLFRLAVKEKCVTLKIRTLKRNLEES